MEPSNDSSLGSVCPQCREGLAPYCLCSEVLKCSLSYKEWLKLARGFYFKVLWQRAALNMRQAAIKAGLDRSNFARAIKTYCDKDYIRKKRNET